jgi:hypothetical protein
VTLTNSAAVTKMQAMITVISGTAAAQQRTPADR